MRKPVSFVELPPLPSSRLRFLGYGYSGEQMCAYAMNAISEAIAQAERGVRWRVGRKVGRTIYRQLGAEPSDSDPLIGVMDTPELAARVVEAVNKEQR